MTQQKTKEEFPITRVINKWAFVTILPNESGFTYTITKDWQEIIMGTAPRGKVINISHTWEKLWKRDIWAMLKKAIKNGVRFNWHTSLNNEQK